MDIILVAKLWVFDGVEAAQTIRLDSAWTLAYNEGVLWGPKQYL